MRQKIKDMDNPCVVCQKKEEVNSGMCKDCLKDAISYSRDGLNRKESKGFNPPFNASLDTLNGTRNKISE